MVARAGFRHLPTSRHDPWLTWPVLLDFSGHLTGHQIYRIPTGTSNNALDLATVGARVAALAPRRDGTYQSFSANVPRIVPGRGYYNEASRADPVKFSNDYTNAAWTKTNVTVAKVTGPDGVTGSACSLTLTATGVGTVTQALTGQTAGLRIAENDIIRVTGTPTVELSADGTTFDTVSPTATAWRHLTSNVAGLSCGTSITPSIRITGNAGDAITAFAFNDCLGSTTFPTTPIVTTNVSVTRGLDDFTFPIPADLGDATQTTQLVWMEPLVPTLSTGTMYDVSDNSLNNRLTVNWRLLNPGTGQPDYHSGLTIGYGGAVAGYDPQDPGFTLGTNGPIHCFGFTMDRTANRVGVCYDGGPFNELVNVNNFPSPGMTTLRIGRHATGVPTNGFIRAVAIRKGVVTANRLRAYTGMRITTP